MHIRLDKIDNEPLRWSETQTIAASAIDHPDLTALGEVSWNGEVSRNEAGFLLTAKFSYTQILACPRCLVTTERPVAGDLQLLVRRAHEEPMLGEHELGKTELSTVYAQDEAFDLQPLLLEQVALNVPMQPLCSDTCAGLCPACGVDRNRETCSCVKDETDPRWAALRQLRPVASD